MSTTLRNAYVEKTATSERSCYICMKMTTKVLTAKDGGDWFYICPSHLQDPGFASGEGFPPVPTAEALAAVSAIKKKKADAEKKKQLEAEAAVKKDTEDKKSHAAKLGSAVFSGLGSVASKAASSVTSFINDEEATKARIQAQELERRQAEARKKPAYWVLHRDIFFLRQTEVKKKNTKKTASETLNGISFPKVPGGP
ncbi:hypothetical protein EMPS_00410 [Entomortierella parvispora]|uniref:VPS4-associated protein 1 n=1 Tax=Entomortierella parvispora TaxID=205924 RepID=A0A9P3LRP2_9FUNG|nr:hypothetical protein EMPS_00410 [Entomortierella parvispora]